MKGFEFRRTLKKDLTEILTDISPERGEILASKLEYGLPAISLNAHDALISAVLNDTGGDFIFAQQVVVYGAKGDLLIAISTSGNSQNIIDAAITGKAMGMKVIGFTGENGGKLKDFCDLKICAPAATTRKLQEYHLPIYHAICRAVEQNIFENYDSIKKYE